MPVRTYGRKVYGGAHSLAANGYCLDTEEDIDKLNKSLVFLDLSTGLYNRGITRDPICGLGDLPAEIDILQGCALKHRARSTNSDLMSPNRDPILLRGDLGAEYNCLYTTKDLTCRQINDRNIITLEGDLGVELDPIRPHGGRPRNCIKNDAVRNPITGSGDFGIKEWDPIWKYEGRHVLKRPDQLKRDPLTHRVPMVNMGETEPRSRLKHFDLKRDTNVIRHEDRIRDLRGTEEMISGIRHYPNQQFRDPITHIEKPGCPQDKPYRSGTKHFHDRFKNEEILEHHGFSDDLTERHLKEEHSRLQQQFRVMDDPISHHGFSDDIEERAVKEQQARLKAKDRVPRDPISGSGINEQETMTLWIYPNDYCFRSFLMPRNRNAEKNNEKPAKDPNNKK